MTIEPSDTMTSGNAVLEELDRFATDWERNSRRGEDWTCRRDATRRAFRAACDIWYFEDQGSHIRRQTGRTRNLSGRGISLISKCVVLMGVPVEIRISPPGGSTIHLGGLVAFCRYAKLGYHEIGVELEAHADKPIFADDPAEAIRAMPWLREALLRLRQGRKPAKRDPRSEGTMEPPCSDDAARADPGDRGTGETGEERT